MKLGCKASASSNLIDVREPDIPQNLPDSLHESIKNFRVSADKISSVD